MNKERAVSPKAVEAENIYSTMEGCPNSTSIASSCAQENSTALSSADFQGLLAVHIILLLVSIAAILLNITSIMSLIVISTILKLFKILLINILVADLLASVAVLLSTGASTVLLPIRREDPPLEVCTAITFVFPLGIAARMCSLTAYSVTMFLVIIRGVKKLKTYYVVVGMIFVWFIAAVLACDRLIPQAAGVRYLHDTFCIPFSGNGVVIREVRITFRVIWNVFGGAVPLILSSMLPIISLCYIRKVTISGNPLYTKALTKLALFLVLSEFFTFSSMLLTTVLPFLSQDGLVDDTDTVYMGVFLLTATVIPTPVLILIFLKTVRTSTARLLTCGSNCKACLKLNTKSEEIEMLSYHGVRE